MDTRLAGACQEFEAMLLRPLFAALKPHMFAQTTQGESIESNSNDASGLVDSLFADALAMAFARAGGVGLARELKRSLESPSR